MSRSAIASLIERRLLVNFRLDPEAAARILPAGTRPLLRRGHAVGGICLIRLAGMRRTGGTGTALPSLADLAGRFGLRSEIAVHRIATVWDGPDGQESGVYIPRRDTDSRLTTLTAGLFLPGEHHLARFEVQEWPDRVRIGFRSADETTHARIEAQAADRLRGSALFADLDEAARFLREAPDGYAALPDAAWDGPDAGGQSGSGNPGGPEESGSERGEQPRREIRAFSVRPAALIEVSSSYFEDPERFPPGTAEPDSALLVRDLEALREARPARRAHRPARPAVHPI
ncbi:DUF2071 domain-containing protein [Actinospica durhamensis]|uniref:DUF2071 domain-containing protein n=1 Tax=Actinospica durhamensis TaxID=1508375 RepID=A0A941ISP8_9ACTN|nr:DUF2071 domain-containing protein [Actinospica durhamensis]MBR7836637.1 DUF2071 domain-containing protein [Actinospica durhamensis]